MQLFLHSDTAAIIDAWKESLIRASQTIFAINLMAPPLPPRPPSRPPSRSVAPRQLSVDLESISDMGADRYVNSAASRAGSYADLEVSEREYDLILRCFVRSFTRAISYINYHYCVP